MQVPLAKAALSVILFCLVNHSYGADELTRAELSDSGLYEGIIGDWQGELQFQLSCTNERKSCAFQLILLPGHLFLMKLGPGCFAKKHGLRKRRKRQQRDLGYDYLGVPLQWGLLLRGQHVVLDILP